MARRDRRALHGHGDAAVGSGRIGAAQARRVLIVLAIGVLYTACAHQRQAVPVLRGVVDLAVVTWNVHGDAGDVAALIANLRSGALTGGPAPREFVLLLQEASERTRVEGLQWFFAPARTVRGRERGNAILSTLPLMSPRVIELPRERQRRVAAVATIRAGGEELVLANVHLENRASWWKGGLLGDRARARQMQALLPQLPPGPGILGGDLNVWLGTREEALRAAAASFPDHLDAEALPTFRERLALDHLLFRLPDGWTAARLRAPQRYGSDHFPVVGILVSP